jgi:hypothetical protein
VTLPFGDLSSSSSAYSGQRQFENLQISALRTRRPPSLNPRDIAPGAGSSGGLQIRPSYFLDGMSPSPPTPPPPPAQAACLGGEVSECGSAPSGTCTPSRDLHITCKPGKKTASFPTHFVLNMIVF